MCNSVPRSPKSLNDERVQAYKIVREKGLGIDTLPKKTDPSYQNEVNRRRLSIRSVRSSLRIPTGNLQSGSGLQL